MLQNRQGGRAAARLLRLPWEIFFKRSLKLDTAQAECTAAVVLIDPWKAYVRIQEVKIMVLFQKLFDNDLVFFGVYRARAIYQQTAWFYKMAGVL